MRLVGDGPALMTRAVVGWMGGRVRAVALLPRANETGKRESERRASWVAVCKLDTVASNLGIRVADKFSMARSGVVIFRRDAVARRPNLAQHPPMEPEVAPF